MTLFLFFFPPQGATCLWTSSAINRGFMEALSQVLPLFHPLMIITSDLSKHTAHIHKNHTARLNGRSIREHMEVRESEQYVLTVGLCAALL